MLKKIVVLVVSLMLVFAVAGCKGSGQKVGKSIDEGVNKTGKFFKKTGKQIKKAVD